MHALLWKKDYPKGLTIMLKNVIVKIVQVAAGVLVGVAMNHTVNKYAVEPSRKKIDSKMGRPNKVSFYSRNLQRVL